MLESLISSRIRRTLVEYILTHPSDRFYLRGLAKSLDLAVSPLRRELKRLEQAGVLQPDLEGNMLFYTVNTGSPIFVQLQQAAGTAAPAAAMVASAASGVILPEPAPRHGGGQAPALNGNASPAQTSALARASAWSSPLGTPVLLGAAVIGTGLILLIAGLAYLGMGQQEFISQASRSLKVKTAGVTVVVPPASSASGTMRGSRYQVVPGGFGGFSSGDRHESY